MKRYQSHKIVEAAPIYGVDPSAFEVVVGDGERPTNVVNVPHDFYMRGVPSSGDYLVRYQPDGYLSWSPKAVFEAGYTEVAEASDTWQGRAVAELDELAARIHKLRVALLEGRPLAGRVTELMQAQLRAMGEYYEALHHRLALTGALPPIREGSPSARSKTAQLDIAKAMRDACGWGIAHAEKFDGSKETVAEYWKTRDAWIAQYLARPPKARPSEADRVLLNVSAPEGKRAIVVIEHGTGEISTFTIVGGQRQPFGLLPGSKMTITDGQPHSTVEQVFSPD